MKNAFIIFFLIFGSIILRAQNISVTSFSPLPNDLTANTAGTEVKDQNGEKAALIRIQTTQIGFSFDAGMMGVVKTIQKTGEIWLYIPKGSKRITLRHQQLGTCEYTYPCAIEAARTYEMKLSTGIVQTIVSQDAGGNFLVMKVSPEIASVYVDDKLQQNDSKGEYSIFLGYGEHTYRVESANCTSQSGLVVIGEDNSIVNIELESTLATLTINCPTPDAKIFLNKQFKGNDSWTGSISSGKYLIEVTKDGHRKIIDNVEIAEKEVKVVTLQALQPIYGMLKVNVKPIGSEIKLDGKNIGVTPKIIKDVLIGEHSLVVFDAIEEAMGSVKKEFLGDPEGSNYSADKIYFSIQILDSKGNKIAGSDSLDISILKREQKVVNDDLEMKDLKGTPYYINSRQLGRTGWTLAVLQHRELAFCRTMRARSRSSFFST